MSHKQSIQCLVACSIIIQYPCDHYVCLVWNSSFTRRISPWNEGSSAETSCSSQILDAQVPESQSSTPTSEAQGRSKGKYPPSGRGVVKGRPTHTSTPGVTSLPSDNDSPAGDTPQRLSSSSPEELVKSHEDGATTNKSQDKVNYISKYLVQFVPVTPTRKSATRVSGARVLTSDKCASILKEKEEKKRKAAEEKEKRKLEKEQKKEERELLKKKKEEERAKKAAERESKSKKQTATTRKRTSNKTLSPAVEASHSSQPVTSGSTSAATLTNVEAEACPREKRRRVTRREDSEIDPNSCCVCYRTFQDDEIEQTGLEWLQCACSRWLHEECIEYELDELDANALRMALLCPYCCV